MITIITGVEYIYLVRGSPSSGGSAYISERVKERERELDRERDRERA